jgi:hypothetical protein
MIEPSTPLVGDEASASTAGRTAGQPNDTTTAIERCLSLGGSGSRRIPNGGGVRIMVTRSAGRDVASARHTVQKAALAVAVVFLLVGVLGFIPGVTTDYSSMTFAGHHSDAKLLGVFEVSVLHNIVHLLFGLAGLAMARTVSGARTYLIGGGAIYLVLWLYGLIVGQDSGTNFVPLNPADDWLHLVLGLGMIALGLITTRRAVRA